MKDIKNERGFTFVEVLVVVAIVIIIFSIAVARYSPARRIAQANDAQRLVEVKSISSAIKSYFINSDGQLPDCDGLGAIPLDDLYRCIGTAELCCDLESALVPGHISEIPEDPTDAEEDKSGYEIKRDISGGV